MVILLKISAKPVLQMLQHYPSISNYEGLQLKWNFTTKYLRIHIEEFNPHLSEPMITDSSFHLIPKPTHLLPIPQPNNGPTLQGDIDNQCFHVWDFSGSNA